MKPFKNVVGFWNRVISFMIYTILPFIVFWKIFILSKVVSGSMTPSIYTHDIVLAVPYTISLVDLLTMLTMGISSLFYTNFLSKIKIFNTPIITLRCIERGDVVAFSIPQDTSLIYTKRIIGMPNDKVQIYHGRIFINNTPIETKYMGFTSERENNKNFHGQIYEETLGNRKYNILRTQSMGRSEDTTMEFFVPKGHYLMFGDNRDHSADSRSIISFIPQEDIIAEAVVTMISNSDFTSLNWKFLSSFRFNKMLKLIR